MAARTVYGDSLYVDMGRSGLIRIEGRSLDEQSDAGEIADCEVSHKKMITHETDSMNDTRRSGISHNSYFADAFYTDIFESITFLPLVFALLHAGRGHIGPRQQAYQAVGMTRQDTRGAKGQ